jgi:hypothetical protein
MNKTRHKRRDGEGGPYFQKFRFHARFYKSKTPISDFFVIVVFGVPAQGWLS